MMRITLFFLIGILLSSCKETPKQDFYVVNVEAKNVYNGIRSYIQIDGARGRKQPIDTAIVMNEALSFNGKLDKPGLYYLTVDNVPGQLPLFLENSNIEVVLNKENIFTSTVTGSASNDLYKAYNDKFRELSQQYSRTNQVLNGRRVAKDSAGMEKYEKEFKKLQEELQQLPVKFAKEHSDSYVALYNATNLLKYRQPDFELITEIFNSLDSNLQNSPAGLSIKVKLDQFKLQAERDAKTAVGEMAPEFSGPSIDGSTISLKEVTSKGKVTLLDFWAAWCGPCRKENPNVVRIYEKYHDKGLEIVSVSLDGDPARRQANPKLAWEEAIAKDGLDWYHISNLKGFQGPIAQSYNIRGIPAMFLLDSDGKIIDKNLRGLQLEQRIAGLLE